MSIYLPELFSELKKFIIKNGEPCRVPNKGIVLEDGLYLFGHVLSAGGRCIRDEELAWALEATSFPDCTEKATPPRLHPPYIEYYADGEYALALANGGDGVYLLENDGGAVRCVCKTNIPLVNFIESAEILEKWIKRLALA
ncbi:hypothetical protein [Pyrobaculum aerophilum]|uniref:Uncharacterized protein n=2 Tax=Pyrobaculum aerophilum TaxID=13773 RepID=Q8ZUU7_PYRAE|nr:MULTISPECIES: hypothetical protein [Pyrobaculum]AAL64309.1 hypothetical protein PAE2600 [Pyrobaculum aerophilum str. IM2]MCX8137911.1 hypothetical protein [Pyrobaculum aerophilum]HII47925.1 hypothetical protein [Pyrobaculum aerophilum]